MARKKRSKGQHGKDSGKTTGQNTQRTEQSSQSEDAIVSNDGTTVPKNGKSTNPSGMNDPAWYGIDPRLLADAANFSYAEALGTELQLEDGASMYHRTADTTADPIDPRIVTKKGIPGVVTLRVLPTFGTQHTSKDPLNVSANMLYTYLRHANSGRKNYDPSDSMIYVVTVGELYSFIQWCKRNYNLCFMYSQRNYYIGKSLLENNLVDVDDMKANLANFRYWLNAFINKVSAYVMPSEITLFQRKVFMYSSYYIENPYGNIKDQLYQFAPDGFYKFQLDGTGKGQLRMKYMDPNYVANRTTRANYRMTVQDIISFGEDLLSAIWGDEDFSLISGDILHAYEGKIIGLTTQEEAGMAAPVYDPYVLSQFKNATIVGSANLAATSNAVSAGKELYYTDGNGNVLNEKTIAGDLWQDSNGNLQSDVIIEPFTNAAYQSAVVCRYAQILSIENPQPSPADSIEATRLMAKIESVVPQNVFVVEISGGGYSAPDPTSLTTRFLRLSVGCEYITSVWVQDSVSAIPTSYVSQTIGTTNITSTKVMEASCFKYLPIFYAYKASLVAGLYRTDEYYPVTNIDNYTIVTANMLRKLHECAMLSLLYLPGVARVIN